MKNTIAKLVSVGRIELFEEDLTKLRPGEVLVRVGACGICGSDIHYFKHGGLGSWKEKMPMWIGHEPAGIVSDANESKAFKDGQRVAIEPGRSCVAGEDMWCRLGRHNLCPESIYMGGSEENRSALPGCFAKYVVVHESQLASIPVNMPLEVAAFMEPLGVALHTWDLLQPKPGESCVIVGSGAIGLSLLVVARRIGLKKVYVVDTHEYRLKLARSLGAEVFVRKTDYPSIIRKRHSDSDGTDYSLDAAGNDESIDGCIRTVRAGGKVALVGIPESDFIHINPHKSRISEIALQNVRRKSHTLQRCLQLFGDSCDHEPIREIITHTDSLEHVQKAFDMVRDRRKQVIKCAIVDNLRK